MKQARLAFIADPRSHRPVDEAADKQAQIEAAWATRDHYHAPGQRRRVWLIAHLRAQGDRCAYCDEQIALGPQGDATLDHKIALVRGGEDSFENSVAACALCNSAKDDLLPEQFALVRVERCAAIMERRAKRSKWRGRYSFRFP